MNKCNIRIMFSVDETDTKTLDRDLKSLGMDVHDMDSDLGIIDGEADESKIKDLIACKSVSFIEFRRKDAPWIM